MLILAEAIVMLLALLFAMMAGHSLDDGEHGPFMLFAAVAFLLYVVAIIL